jgi:hypothetical protein
MGNQKIPKRKSENTKEEIRIYQRGNQNISKRKSEYTKRVIRIYQKGNEKKFVASRYHIYKYLYPSI